MRLSATRIRTYLTCPRKYRYAYIDDIPVVPTGPVAFGRVMHQTLYALHQQSMDNGSYLNVEDGFATFDRLWRETLEQEQPLFKEGDGAQRYWDLADDMLRGYVSLQHNLPPPIAVEFPFEVSWYSHSLAGIVDRIDASPDGVVILDYKTGQRKPTSYELQNDLQLTLYALAVEHIFERPVEQITYYHLRDQTFFSTTRTKRDFNRLIQSVLPRVNQLAEPAQSTPFEPRYGYWCRFCDFRELCQAQGPRTDLFCANSRQVANQHQDLPQVSAAPYLLHSSNSNGQDSSKEPQKPSTLAQHHAIYALIARAQLAEDELTRLLQARFSRSSVEALTYAQAASLLLELQRKERLKAQAANAK